MNKVILSLFGGVGLLDMGFEAAGFCVVRAGDLLWGSDIKKFDATPLKGKIAGVIGGVPCQAFSSAVKKENRCKHENLWPEYYRIIKEVKPDWFLAENVKGAKDEALSMFNTPNDYFIKAEIHDFSKLGSAQKRIRLITFGARDKKILNGFWSELNKNGLKWGLEWRKIINRDIKNIYRTIIGDGTNFDKSQSVVYQVVTGTFFEQQDSKNKIPCRTITGDDFLDAFDLPKKYTIGHDKSHRIPKYAIARLITQGVPVAAAYALAMAVKAALGATVL